ncbi:MAG: c-type cytochrome [Rhizobiales bacterium]|nr:c-type cytochrome [Hyphomicrobiales bacterium]
MRGRTIAAATTALALSCGPALALDVEAARKQFVTSCGVCHAVEKDAAPRQGPNLFGVVGRKAASLEGFAYSPALKQLDTVWSDDTLDAWIADPKAVAPGSVMIYRQADPAKRLLIIAYLKTLSN